MESLPYSPYWYQANRASDRHLASTCFIISSHENVLKALVRSTWEVTMPLSLCTPVRIAWHSAWLPPLTPTCVWASAQLMGGERSAYR